MSGRSDRNGRRDASTQAAFLTEEEAYLEHRCALDATLFRRFGPVLTFELESGSLNLVPDAPGGDRPRD